MREKEKVKKMKKVEEEDEEGEEEQRKEKSKLFFIFSPLSSSCFSSIYSISIHCFFYAACHLQERKRTFFFSSNVGRGLVQLNIALSMRVLCALFFYFFSSFFFLFFLYLFYFYSLFSSMLPTICKREREHFFFLLMLVGAQFSLMQLCLWGLYVLSFFIIWGP